MSADDGRIKWASFLLLGGITLFVALAVAFLARRAAASPPDTIAAVFTNSITGVKREFPNADLQTINRIAMARHGAYERAVRINAETNAMLWRQYQEAELGPNKKNLAQAESALASFLVRQLESMDGKTYPAKMKLSEIMEKYKAFSENNSSSSGQAK